MMLFLKKERLNRVREEIQAGSQPYIEALQYLLQEADQALTKGPFTVVNKPFLPPSGNKHDYMSMGLYWWPNPDTEDGLPYIRKDGLINPETKGYDQPQMGGMTSTVETLALAYYYSGNSAYGEKAAQLLKVFFLEDETKMNPHLEYGQGIPGICTGRCIGIIDMWVVPKLLDYVDLLEESEFWSREDRQGLERWFSELLDWLLTSPLGQEEDGQKNNHGTYYDVQVAAYAWFTGRKDLARQVLEMKFHQRMKAQIEPDGSQPHELERTLAFTYSSMNLSGLMELASIGELLGMDLWSAASEDGRGIQAAVDWLTSFAGRMEEFPYQQINAIDPVRAGIFLRRADYVYRKPDYESAFQFFVGDDPAAHRLNLTYPSPER